MQGLGARRWWALGAVNLSVLAVSLDGTVLSVAQPTLSTALDASQSDLVWFSAGYLLVLAAAVLPVGLVGDRFGRRAVLLASLALFGLGSVLCAYAGSIAVFLTGRLLQGLAGAGITVMALSALVVLFDEHERPRAVAIYQAAAFLALPLGPILGGWMLSQFWWGWVFLLNVPVVVLAAVIGFVLIPESRSAERPGLDPVGTAASAAGLALVIYGLVRAGEHGWGSLDAVLPIAAGAAMVAGFVWWEHRLGRMPAGRPLVDPRLLQPGPFLWGSALAAVAGLAMIGVLFTIPQYFQGVQGTDTLGSGLRLLPLIAGMVVGAGLSGRLLPAITARLTIALGFVLLAGGLAIAVTTTPTSDTAFTAGWTALVGAGTGLALSAATAAALAGLSAERSGTESAIVQAFNKTSGPLGTAITGSILVAVYHTRLDSAELPATVAESARRSLYDGTIAAHAAGAPGLEQAIRSAFVDGMSVAFLASAAIALLGAVMALVLLPRGQSRGTEAGQPTEEGTVDAVAH
ncbi:DHA2 family efflux MFS transporter permease subunit [Parafrankia sp. BMG5.11]|uniref:DHA2 family efflux MFS transporter permease subunit n=1 Tax=Parafrankia sp. BMG5.11 TaxID=222540 RepID=UPI00103C59A0|nr:DHA2 family efflux MFS transporter permease subunit [Parafrankia sp. BMG5.11]TCJ40428.1 DHA2 family efflux MFS transporter permease subunit [Parafrankia sp. BMG5.11]